MIDFLSLNIYVRTAILLFMLLITTPNLCLLITLVARKKEWYKTLIGLVLTVFTSAVLVYFSSMQNAAVNNLYFDTYGLSGYILPTLPVFAINTAFLCWMAVSFNRERKNSILPSSVKEGFDNLPTGLCFSRKNGMVQLVNHQMNTLSYLLTGSDIQNAESFWQLVSVGQLDDDVERISSGERPEIRFRNGSVWSFARENLGSVVQITATDITEYLLLTKTLEQKNTELKKMNSRLRKHGENVDEVTRSKERLETKVRIHNEFGRSLIATHHALQEEGSLEDIASLWKRNIAVLRMEAEPSADSDQLTALMKSADSVGVKIEIKGRIPRVKETRFLIMAAATETLTNAVKHADAGKMIIEIEELRDSYLVCFTNDGKKPEVQEITEGGGLSSLRKKIENAGGEMYVSGMPEFLLTIKLMKESGDRI
ncbi:MAG: hypothetical protein IIX16_11195 [Clostridia bacterium]|nr:hypothetical protein [Clostridia bacterium]